jgi:hypothetical protein
LLKTASVTVFWIHANGQQDNIYTIDTNQAFLTTVSQAGGLRMLQPLHPDISNDVQYSAVVHGVPRNTAFSYYTNGNLSFGSPGVLQTGYLIYYSLTTLAAAEAILQISSPGVGTVSIIQSTVAPPVPNGWSTQFSNGQLYLFFNPAVLTAGEVPMLPVISVLFGQPTNIEILKATNLRPPPLASIAKGLQVQCVLADASGTRLEPVLATNATSKRHGPAAGPAVGPSSAPAATAGWQIGLYIVIGGFVLIGVAVTAILMSDPRSSRKKRFGDGK